MPQYSIKASVKFGGGRVMVRASISGDGVGLWVLWRDYMEKVMLLFINN